MLFFGVCLTFEHVFIFVLLVQRHNLFVSYRVLAFFLACGMWHVLTNLGMFWVGLACSWHVLACIVFIVGLCRFCRCFCQRRRLRLKKPADSASIVTDWYSDEPQGALILSLFLVILDFWPC